MKEIAAVVVTLLGVISYFVVSTGFGLYQRWPVVHLLICLAACVWLLRLVIGTEAPRRRLWGGAALALSLGLTGLFGWYVLDYSTYASTEARVAEGEDLGGRLATSSLASHDGQPKPVFRPGNDRGTLLVFYRGHW